MHQLKYRRLLIFVEMTDRLTKYFRASSSKSRPRANCRIDNANQDRGISRALQQGLTQKGKNICSTGTPLVKKAFWKTGM